MLGAEQESIVIWRFEKKHIGLENPKCSEVEFYEVQQQYEAIWKPGNDGTRWKQIITVQSGNEYPNYAGKYKHQEIKRQRWMDCASD